MGLNFISIFLLLWAFEWIYYSWKKPFKTFLKVGFYSSIPSLLWIGFIGMTIFFLMTMFTYCETLNRLNIFLPPKVVNWSLYGLIALMLLYGFGVFTITKYTQKRMKEVSKEAAR